MVSFSHLPLARMRKAESATDLAANDGASEGHKIDRLIHGWGGFCKWSEENAHGFSNDIFRERIWGVTRNAKILLTGYDVDNDKL